MTAASETALQTLQRGLERSPDAFETALILGVLGEAHLGRGDLVHAVAVLEQAVQEANRYRSRQVQAWFKSFLAKAYVSLGRLEAASGLATEAIALVTETKSRGVVLDAHLALGSVARARGDLAEADTHLREALEIATSQFWVAHVHLELAVLARTRGNRESAAMHLLEAQTRFKSVRVPRWVERTEELAREFVVSLPAD